MVDQRAEERPAGRAREADRAPAGSQRHKVHRARSRRALVTCPAPRHRDRLSHRRGRCTWLRARPAGTAPRARDLATATRRATRTNPPIRRPRSGIRSRHRGGGERQCLRKILCGTSAASPGQRAPVREARQRAGPAASNGARRRSASTRTTPGYISSGPTSARGWTTTRKPSATTTASSVSTPTRPRHWRTDDPVGSKPSWPVDGHSRPTP